jgi:hypothetical protein
VAKDIAGNKRAPGCLLMEDAQLIPHLERIAHLGNIAVAHAMTLAHRQCEHQPLNMQSSLLPASSPEGARGMG